MATTDLVLSGLQKFMQKRGLDQRRLKEAVSLEETKDPLRWWGLADKDMRLVKMSKMLQFHLAQLNPGQNVGGEKLSKISFRVPYLYRTLTKQVTHFKKTGQSNRCLVYTGRGDVWFWCNLYPVSSLVLALGLDESAIGTGEYWWLFSEYSQEADNTNPVGINLIKTL